MIAALAIALLTQVTPATLRPKVWTEPFDTEWRTASNNIWPQNYPDFEFWIDPARPSTTQAQACGEMWIDAWIAVHNASDAPIWCAGSLSMRYNLCHDDLDDPTDQDYGVWRWWIGAQGAQFEIPEGEPLLPGETRFLRVQEGGAGNIICFDVTSTMPLWQQSGRKVGSFDAYYPSLAHVNGQQMPGGPQDPNNWESLGLFAWVMTPEEYGYHVPPPKGRLNGWVEYR